jgi:hypothetical protein
MSRPESKGLPYDLRVDYKPKTGNPPPIIPQGAIDQLKNNPKQAIFFDQKYGKGASKKYLEVR